MEMRRLRVVNMQRIAKAMQQYHEKHGRFPPAVVTNEEGKPLYSWRVLLLPYLDGDALYRRFHLNRAWDHPSNRPLLDQMPSVFADSGVNGVHATPYQVLTGSGGLFDDPDGRRSSEVTDGAARTILFVGSAEDVPWTMPSDFIFDSDRVGLLGKGRIGFHAAFADGTVRYIPRSWATPDLFRSLFTRTGGERVTVP
jgi:hypothetical protein